MKTKQTEQIQYHASRVWPEHAWKTDMPFPPEVIAAGEWRGESEHVGMWHILTKYRAIAMEMTEFDADKYPGTHAKTAIIYGVRSLEKPKQSGYDLEGYVSINGERLRAFTSSAMFEVNGKLVDVAILYVCRPKEGK